LYGPTLPAPVNVYPVVVHHGFIQAKRASAFAEQKEENEPDCMSEHGGLLLATRPLQVRLYRLTITRHRYFSNGQRSRNLGQTFFAEPLGG
jgi:hypothetical protein